MHWASEYVGIPYAENGYDRSGCFCWGLVRLVLMEQFGITIPRHDEADIYAVNDVASRYDSVSMNETQSGDVVHMWGIIDGRRSPTHVGVVTKRGFVLHIERGTGAIVESVKSKRFAWRIIDAYRPRNDEYPRRRNAS